MIASAVTHAHPAAIIRHRHETEATFVLLHAIDPLAVRAAFDRWLLVERPGADDRQGGTAAGRVITVRAIVRRQHVGVAVQDAQPANLVLFDEVGDLAALRGEDTPVIFAERKFPPGFPAAGRLCFVFLQFLLFLGRGRFQTRRRRPPAQRRREIGMM